MLFLYKAALGLSIFFASQAFAQGQPENTMRAGSGGSAGTTQQGPAYDGGVLGPNAAMGGPDVTAVDPEGNVRRKVPKKKSVGTIRVDAEEPVRQQPTNPSTTK